GFLPGCDLGRPPLQRALAGHRRDGAQGWRRTLPPAPAASDHRRGVREPRPRTGGGMAIRPRGRAAPGRATAPGLPGLLQGLAQPRRRLRPGRAARRRGGPGALRQRGNGGGLRSRDPAPLRRRRALLRLARILDQPVETARPAAGPHHPLLHRATALPRGRGHARAAGDLGGILHRRARPLHLRKSVHAGDRRGLRRGPRRVPALARSRFAQPAPARLLPARPARRQGMGLRHVPALGVSGRAERDQPEERRGRDLQLRLQRIGLPARLADLPLGRDSVGDLRMRRRSAIVACALALGCGEGFLPPSYVNELRVLAVRTEPPEIAWGAEEIPSESRISVLVADPVQLLDPTREVVVGYLSCTADPARLEFNPCTAVTTLRSPGELAAQLPTELCEGGGGDERQRNPFAFLGAERCRHAEGCEPLRVPVGDFELPLPPPVFRLEDDL